MMRKLLFAAVCALALTGCGSFGFIEDTGAGRAWDRAWTGVPPQVVESVQFVDEAMGDRLRDEYSAIDEASVTRADGSVDHQAAENRFRDMAIVHAEIEQWETLSEALADYLGFELDEPINTDKKRADKARRKFWKNLQKGAREALKEIDDA